MLRRLKLHLYSHKANRIVPRQGWTIVLCIRKVVVGAVGGNFVSEEGRVVEKKVTVLEHSYARDLPLSAGGPLNGDNSKIVLRQKFFVPGTTVASIQCGRVWERFLDYKPDLTFLLIGGNDIHAQSLPANTACSIITLGKIVKEQTRGEVKIITVERRPVPSIISSFRYNKQRTSINGFLKHRYTFTIAILRMVSI